MNKKTLTDALMSTCVRLLSHYSSHLCPCEPEFAGQVCVLQDIAKSMIAIKEGRDGVLPDVLFEALAYECKTPEPDPHLIMYLTELINENIIRQSSCFPR